VKPKRPAYQLYQYASQFLSDHHIDDASIEAKHIVSHVLETDIHTILLDHDVLCDERAYKKVVQMLYRRISGEPIQYILKSQNFCGFDFYVNAHVLIPRPETELLVEKAIEYISANHTSSVLDLCTGSGCIGISIKKFRPKSQVCASDISRRALSIAKKNAKKLNADINYIHSNLFNQIRASFDIIVSNPPYISHKDYKQLDAKVLDYEPEKALLGGEDGLDIIKRIIAESIYYLNPNGWLMLEIGYDQKQAVSEFLNEAKFTQIQPFSDYAGFDRIMIGKKL